MLRTEPSVYSLLRNPSAGCQAPNTLDQGEVGGIALHKLQCVFTCLVNDYVALKIKQQSLRAVLLLLTFIVLFVF